MSIRPYPGEVVSEERGCVNWTELTDYLRAFLFDKNDLEWAIAKH